MENCSKVARSDRPLLQLRSNSGCFLCLQHVYNVKTSHDEDFGSADTSFKNEGSFPPRKVSMLSICRNLKIRFKSLLLCCVERDSESLLEKVTDCSVTLCDQCSAVIGPLSNMCLELELLQMKVDHYLKSACGLLETSGAGKSSNCQYSQGEPANANVAPPQLEIQTSTGKMKINQQEFAKVLRNEIKRKCKLKLQRAVPKVKMVKDASLAVLARLQGHNKEFIREQDTIGNNEPETTSTSPPPSPLSFDESEAEHSLEPPSFHSVKISQDSLVKPREGGTCSKEATVLKNNISSVTCDGSDSMEMEATTATDSSVCTKAQTKFKCNVCGKVFQHGKNLWRHKKAKHEENVSRAKCDICGYVFQYSHDLSRHKRVVHKLPSKLNNETTQITSGDVDAVPNNQPVSEYYRAKNQKSSFRIVCEICGKDFKNRECLSIHVRGVHEKSLLRMRKVVSSKCDVCGKSFQYTRSLRFHKQTKHQQDIPDFRCAVCGKIFQSPSKLQKHSKAEHQKDIFFSKCKVCDKYFQCKELLRKHMESEHQKKGNMSRRGSPVEESCDGERFDDVVKQEIEMDEEDHSTASWNPDDVE